MRHKTALVSALSMASVLLAGATALGANMSILNNNGTVGELTAVSDSVGGTTTTEDISSADAPTPDLVAYQINDVGVVTLTRVGDELFVESTETGTWAATVASEGPALSLVFERGDRQVRFDASVDGDQILVDVWEEEVVLGETVTTSEGNNTSTTTATGVGSTSTTVPNATSTTLDDDRDDDYSDDAYDDDESKDDDDQDDDSDYEDEDEDEDEHEGREDDD
jgi:hypothetical protein